MKVTSIYIKDFHQFKEFELDLTYPKGHAKEGQPLDKVCFIGQSGTGKTTLLELIPKFIRNYHTNSFPLGGKEHFENVELYFGFGVNNEYKVCSTFEEDDANGWSWEFLDMPTIQSEDSENGREGRHAGIEFFEKKWITETASKLVYFPANLNFDVVTEPDARFDEDRIIDFSKKKVSIVWNLILENIQKYQEQELQIRQEISKTVEQSSNDLETIKFALAKLEEWKKNEFNPIADVADNCLDRLIANFKVRVKKELDVKKREDIGFIKIEDYNKKEIPHNLWSTGTKQLVLTALPLYLLKPKHTIVLFDEPERSLYPDIQSLIIGNYISLTNNCQLIFSTHSPIIASSFEPWEIVELKFDESWNVYREKYYEGDNHVDNYYVDPRYLDYDLILKKIFDMKDTSTDMRMEALVELSMLKNQLDLLKQEDKLKTPQAKEILKRYKSLAQKLVWKPE